MEDINIILSLVPSVSLQIAIIMRAATAISLLVGVAWAPSVQAAVSIDIAKNPAVAARTVLQQRAIQQRATITESLSNNVTGGSYVASVSVGTPPQTQTLIIDTGSSDVWLLSAQANLCSNERLQRYYGGGCSTTCKSLHFLRSACRVSVSSWMLLYNINWLDLGLDIWLCALLTVRAEYS